MKAPYRSPNWMANTWQPFSITDQNNLIGFGRGPPKNQWRLVQTSPEFILFIFIYLLIYFDFDLMASKKYFIYIEPIVHQKPENPGENHLTFKKQNSSFSLLIQARLEFIAVREIMIKCS